MIPLNTTAPPKDTIKRANSTRTNRLSQLFNMSDGSPIPVVETSASVPPKRPEMEINIVVLGDAGVGKSQLLR